MTATHIPPAEVEIVAEAAPGPAGRTQRTAGQAGTLLVFLELVLAFGWFGSGGWTERQVLAVSAVGYVALSAAHNLVNWWTTERRRAPKAVTVEAVDGPAG